MWDALGLARKADGSSAIVLIQAKANVPEFQAAGCRAAHPTSVAMIEAALSTTRTALRATGTSESWRGPQYPLANRLAWTHWLRQQGVDALFAHVLFAGDSSNLPTSEEDLVGALQTAYELLGVDHAAISEWAATIVLPAIG